MESYHAPAMAGNTSFDQNAEDPPGREGKPKKQRYRSELTPYLIVKCVYCKGVFRFENMNSESLKEFRLSHSSTCAEFQIAIANYKARHGEPEYIRNRVKFIGSAIGGSRVMHRQKPDHLLTRCGPRCRNAKGTDCDCICRGQFHGSNHAA
jgi:hypothetical protein